MSLAERLWARVDKSGECWLWTGYCQGSRGYGTIGVGRDRKELVHRVAYRLCIGPIPEGLCVLHRCDVRACVNPAHLFLGTNADNTADMLAKGRESHGVDRHNAKLTDRQVREIATSTARGVDLARRYGVCESTITKIRKGRRRRRALAGV